MVGSGPSVSSMLFVSSGEALEPSAGGCEPSVSEGFFVSSIARSLITTDIMHDMRLELLSHSEPDRESGFKVSTCQANPWASSPDGRNEPVADTPGVVLVASQFRPERPVLQDRPNDEDQACQEGGDHRPVRPERQRYAEDKQERRH